MLKKTLPYIIIAVLLLPVILPLLQDGFFVTDDADWMIIRLSAFHETLKTGQFPVRFLERLNHGYGYPVLNYNYPLPFYLGELIHLSGFGFIDSVKILFLLSLLLGSLAVYKFISEQWGKAAGIVGAIFYSYFPYRLYDIYTRGSLGESVAFIFLPLSFYFLNKSFNSGNLRSTALGVFATAGLITSHNVIAFISLPFLAMFALVKLIEHKFDRKHLRDTVLFFSLSFGLSAFFWLPAIFELKFTRAPTIQISDFNNYFIQTSNYFTLVGPALPLILLLSLFFILIKRKYFLIFPLIVTLVSLFFALPISKEFWSQTALPQLVQFPWRFLSLAAFTGSVLLSYITRKNLVLGLSLLIFTMASSLVLLNIKRSFKIEEYYTTNDSTSTVHNEYQPIWLKSDPQNAPDSKMEILSGRGSVKNNNVSAQTALHLRINKVYFPGWKVYLNGREIPIDWQASGLIELKVPAGVYALDYKFRETPLRITSDLISFGSFLVAILLLCQQS